MKRRTLLHAAGLCAAAACTPSLPLSKDAGLPLAAAPGAPVEVWHDLICPWCRIGVHNLTRALSGDVARVAFRPFLLDPSVPDEGVDLRERLQKKYGVSADGMFDRVTQAGARHGVSFQWDKVRITPNTVPGHVLLSLAPAAKGHALVERLHRAYFDEGQNFGDRSVLTALAKDAGVDEGLAARAFDPGEQAKIRQAAQAASAAGITGVPFFRTAKGTLSGAQPPETLQKLL